MCSALAPHKQQENVACLFITEKNLLILPTEKRLQSMWSCHILIVLGQYVLPSIGCGKSQTLRFLPETSYISTCAAIHWMWQMSHLETFTWDILHKHLCCNLLDVTNVTPWDFYLRLPTLAPVLPSIGCDKCHTLRLLPETSYISTCAAIYWMWQMSRDFYLSLPT